ncbi:MAG: winged helix-turn-helix transcriptional regulator [Sphingorhabdus sp.]
MPKPTVIDTEICPIAKSAHVMGDRWTLLILRELFFGATRFEAIQVQSGARPQMLTDRLRRLEHMGVILRQPYQQTPLRHEYVLTDKGKDLFSVLYAMRNWAERWQRDQDAPLAITYTHRNCGHDVGLETICPNCGKILEYGDLKGTPSLQSQAARYEKAEAVKSR